MGKNINISNLEYNKKVRKWIFIFYTVIFIIILYLFIPYYSTRKEKSFWYNTLNENTIAQFKLYLNEYPKGKYAQVAFEKIKILHSEIINDIIRDLDSDVKNICSKASSELSKIVEFMNDEQLNRIANIVNNSNKKWETLSYKQSHCSWYDVTSKKYFAAKVFSSEEDKSRITKYVSKSKINVALNDSKRIKKTDPGWI